MFPVNILSTTYIHTCCHYFKPLDHSLKPEDTRIASNHNLPWKSYKHSTPSATLPHIKVIPTCSVTSRYFHLPPHYEDHTLMMNVSLDTTNITVINISTPDFRIWQHFNSSMTPPHLQKLANIPEVPVTQLYRDMINTSEPIHTFTIKDDDENLSLIWTLLTHPGTYIGTIGMILAVCIGVYCFKRFWFRPSTPKCRPYSVASLWMP